MRDGEEQRSEEAIGAGPDEIQVLVHDLSPRVMRSLLQNRNLSEEDVVIICTRTNLPQDILEAVARDKRWSDSYRARLALARNPRTPLTVSLSLARFLRIFDLEELTRNHYVPLVFRKKVESMIMERVPTMPPGNKKTLAKKAAGNVLLKLLQDRLPDVVALCLNNPHMVEAHLYKVISRKDTPPKTITLIAGHPLWSGRSLVRFALVRNEHTPLALSAEFMRTMKVLDLRELYQDPSLPAAVRPLVHRELVRRGFDPAVPVEEKIYEIPEKELADAGIEALEGEDPEAENGMPERMPRE